jgi:hypothetical protein
MNSRTIEKNTDCNAWHLFQNTLPFIRRCHLLVITGLTNNIYFGQAFGLLQINLIYKL